MPGIGPETAEDNPRGAEVVVSTSSLIVGLSVTVTIGFMWVSRPSDPTGLVLA
jgi:hypothetical protein